MKKIQSWGRVKQRNMLTNNHLHFLSNTIISPPPCVMKLPVKEYAKQKILHTQICSEMLHFKGYRNRKLLKNHSHQKEGRPLHLKLKLGSKKNRLTEHLPRGLYFRCSSMNWQGQRAEMQWRGGAMEKPPRSAPSTDSSRCLRTYSLAQRCE